MLHDRIAQAGDGARGVEVHRALARRRAVVGVAHDDGVAAPALVFEAVRGAVIAVHEHRRVAVRDERAILHADHVHGRRVAANGLLLPRLQLHVLQNERCAVGDDEPAEAQVGKALGACRSLDDHVVVDGVVLAIERVAEESAILANGSRPIAGEDDRAHVRIGDSLLEGCPALSLVVILAVVVDARREVDGFLAVDVLVHHDELFKLLQFGEVAHLRPFFLGQRIVSGARLLHRRPGRIGRFAAVDGLGRRQRVDHLHDLFGGRQVVVLLDGEAVVERARAARRVVGVRAPEQRVVLDGKRRVDGLVGLARLCRGQVVLHDVVELGARGGGDHERRARRIHLRLVGVARRVGHLLRGHARLGAIGERRRAHIGVVVAREHKVDVVLRGECAQPRAQRHHVGVVLVRALRVGRLVRDEDLPRGVCGIGNFGRPLLLRLAHGGIAVVGVQHDVGDVAVNEGVVQARGGVLIGDVHVVVRGDGIGELVVVLARLVVARHRHGGHSLGGIGVHEPTPVVLVHAVVHHVAQMQGERFPVRLLFRLGEHRLVRLVVRLGSALRIGHDERRVAVGGIVLAVHVHGITPVAVIGRAHAVVEVARRHGGRRRVAVLLHDVVVGDEHEVEGDLRLVDLLRGAVERCNGGILRIHLRLRVVGVACRAGGNHLHVGVIDVGGGVPAELARRGAALGIERHAHLVGQRTVFHRGVGLGVHRGAQLHGHTANHVVKRIGIARKARHHGHDEPADLLVHAVGEILVQQARHQAAVAEQVKAELVEHRGDGGVVAAKQRLHGGVPQRVAPEKVVYADGGVAQHIFDKRDERTVQNVRHLVFEDVAALQVLKRVLHVLWHRLLVGAGVVALEHVLQQLAQGVAVARGVVRIVRVQQVDIAHAFEQFRDLLLEATVGDVVDLDLIEDALHFLFDVLVADREAGKQPRRARRVEVHARGVEFAGIVPRNVDGAEAVEVDGRSASQQAGQRVEERVVQVKPRDALQRRRDVGQLVEVARRIAHDKARDEGFAVFVLVAVHGVLHVLRHVHLVGVREDAVRRIELLVHGRLLHADGPQAKRHLARVLRGEARVAVRRGVGAQAAGFHVVDGVARRRGIAGDVVLVHVAREDVVNARVGKLRGDEAGVVGGARAVTVVHVHAVGDELGLGRGLMLQHGMMDARDDVVALFGELGRLILYPCKQVVAHHAGALPPCLVLAVPVGGVHLGVDHDESDARSGLGHVGQAALAVGDAVFAQVFHKVVDALNSAARSSLRGFLVKAHRRVDAAEVGLGGPKAARAAVLHLRVVLEGHGVVVVEVMVAGDHEHGRARLLQALHLRGEALVARLLALARQVARDEQHLRQFARAAFSIGEHLVDGSRRQRPVLSHQAQVAGGLVLVCLRARALVLRGKVMRVAHDAEQEAIHRARRHCRRARVRLLCHGLHNRHRRNGEQCH